MYQEFFFLIQVGFLDSLIFLLNCFNYFTTSKHLRAVIWIFNCILFVSLFLFVSFAYSPYCSVIFAYGNSWTKMGPWDIGPAFRVIAVFCIGISVVVFYVGVQPPNDFALKVVGVIGLLTAIAWFGIENRRFKGPPIGHQIAARAAEIAAAEAAVGEA